MTLLIKGPLKLFIAEVTISKCQLPPNWHLFKISSEIQRMFSFPCTFIGLAFIALTLQGIKEGKGGGIKCVLRNTFKFIFTQVITSVEKVYKQQSTVVPFETWTLCWWKPQGLEITPLPELEPSGQIPPNWICLKYDKYFWFELQSFALTSSFEWYFQIQLTHECKMLCLLWKLDWHWTACHKSTANVLLPTSVHFGSS